MTALKLNLPFGTARMPDALIRNEKAMDKSALAKARRLAERHRLAIAPDHGGFWVNGPLDDDSEKDPIRGEHFCADGREVLEKVELYVEAIKGEAK